MNQKFKFIPKITFWVSEVKTPIFHLYNKMAEVPLRTTHQGLEDFNQQYLTCFIKFSDVDRVYVCGEGSSYFEMYRSCLNFGFLQSGKWIQCFIFIRIFLT